MLQHSIARRVRYLPSRFHFLGSLRLPVAACCLKRGRVDLRSRPPDCARQQHNSLYFSIAESRAMERVGWIATSYAVCVTAAVLFAVYAIVYGKLACKNSLSRMFCKASRGLLSQRLHPHKSSSQAARACCELELASHGFLSCRLPTPAQTGQDRGH